MAANETFQQVEILKRESDYFDAVQLFTLRGKTLHHIYRICRDSLGAWPLEREAILTTTTGSRRVAEPLRLAAK